MKNKIPIRLQTLSDRDTLCLARKSGREVIRWLRKAKIGQIKNDTMVAKSTSAVSDPVKANKMTVAPAN